MPDNQINEADLEKQTNEMLGWEPTPEVGQSLEASGAEPGAAPSGANAVADSIAGKPESDESKAVPEPPETKPEKKDDVDYAARVKELEEQFKALSDTPYKAVTELVKGYKEIQGQYTKVNEKVKPFEQLLDQVGKDPTLRNFVQQAVQAYYNPQMLEAYNQSGVPDPKSYDMFSEDGMAKYHADTKAYYERTIDQRIGARLSQVESANAVERAKMEFKAKYPNEDPEKVIAYAKEREGSWGLEDYYKIQNYDSLKSQSLEAARKEVTNQLEAAQKASPVASSAPKVSVKPDDILNHISRYGSDSAMKKFTKAKVEEALMNSL